MKDEIIRCGNCGREIGQRVRCPHCGHNMDRSPDQTFDPRTGKHYRQKEMPPPAAPQAYPADPEPRLPPGVPGPAAAKTLLFVAVIGAVVMAIGVVAVLFFTGGSMQETSAPEVLSGSSASALQPGHTVDLAPDAVGINAAAGSTAPLIAPDPDGPAAAGATVEAGSTAPAPVDGELTEEQAIDRVAALPEVKKWMALIARKSPGNKAAFRSEGLQMGRYLIQAYEDVDDGNGQGHTATFGWYEVDKKTGEVVKAEE